MALDIAGLWNNRGARHPYSTVGRTQILLLCGLLFFAATGGALLAQAYDRPVSAALIFVVGVTVIGAATGLRGGVVAALAASAIYNFFLSEPVLQFGAASPDEYIPLIAFNLTAILTGALAGRLNDRARAAEEAQRRINFLLTVSGRLQTAVQLNDVAYALRQIEGFPMLDRAELYDAAGNHIDAGGPPPRWHPIAQCVMRGALLPSAANGPFCHPLTTPNGTVGAIIFEEDPREYGQVDVEALVTLLSIAVERCSLLNQLAEAEAIRRSEELKTALLSSLSHDMRSPLAAIAASASSLASLAGDLDFEVRQQLLRTIEEQCARLNRFTANMLNLGMLQAGIDDDQLSVVDAVDLLGASIGLARSLQPERPIEKRIDVASALVLANPVMVEQIFTNVLENALQYSPADTAILITGEIMADRVVIGIMDQGCGIPAHALGRVFDRFFRSPRTRDVEGQGLGLSIAKGFAEAFGGDILVFSPHQGGKGTHVQIALPLIAGGIPA